MKDGPGPGPRPGPGPGAAARQALRRDYISWYLQQCAEGRPCRDPRLMEGAARYLRTEPQPGAAFTVFPFQQVLSEGRVALNTDCRSHLSALIRATELLETLCFNLFLQPWRKEIRTVKTYTGPFVYCLLPVLSTSVIQSVMASIGYLPLGGATPSEFRLSQDASADAAELVGFELLLARVECHSLLELQHKEQLGPHELLEALQRRIHPTKGTKPSERKTVAGPKEEEEEKEEGQEEEEEEERAKKKEGVDRKEELQCLVAAGPHPKPRRSHLVSADRSLLEMQETYPDLAFRGRPLVPDKPHKAHTSTGSSKAGQTSEGPRGGSAGGPGGSEGAAVPSRDDDSGTADRGPGDDGAAGCRDDGANEEAVSLHITLRAGLTEGESPGPGAPPPTAEPPPYTQLEAERHRKRSTKPKLASLTSLDEEQELRGLAERMGQPGLQESKEERRSRERRAGEEQQPRRRLRGTEAAGACNDSTRLRAAQSQHTAAREPPKPPGADRHRRGGRRGRLQEEDDPAVKQAGRGEEEEQEEQSFVVL